MARKKAVVPKALLKAWVSLELKARLGLLLISEVEGRIPLGKISEHVERVLTQDLDWKALDLHPFGLPQGYFVRGPEPFVKALECMIQELHKAANQRTPAPLTYLDEANAKS